MRIIIMAASILAIQPCLAAPVRDARMAALGGRLFPVLTRTEVAAVSKEGEERAEAASMLAARRQRIDACGEVPQCVIGAAIWTDAERDLIVRTAEHTLSSRDLPAGQVPDDGIGAQTRREITGLNSLLQVYGLGATPRYPRIDGPDPAESDQALRERATSALKLGETSRDDPVTALDPSIGLSLALLDIDARTDAAAWEPLDSGQYNGPAFALAKTLDWSRYRYTAIIVPGEGPDDLTTPLSPLGKARVRLAASRFADGVAPFIIVSGGMVHPRGTRFAEAVEMRRALIERFGIPAERIVIDPYARHTTTNLRNVSRLLIALHAPQERDALIVTSEEQSRYIESPGFAQRNRQELGYQPGSTGTRLSPTELPFRPAIQSLRTDPLDPLDP